MISAPILLALCLPAADEVVLKDGSRILGEVVEMVEGKLKVKTAFAKEVSIEWVEVASLTVERPLPVVLVEGEVLMGPLAPGGEGRLAVGAGPLPASVPLASVAAIAPPPRPLLSLKGFVAAGLSITEGNTEATSISANGEVEARSERQRLTLRGSTNYAENSERIIARNAKALAKYDYFFTKRLYAFASTLFEGDEFQDLRLRMALSAGPGFQAIEAGDFSPSWLRELQLSGEAGLSYFNEDFEDSPDREYLSARWALRVNWPILPRKVVLFHVHEGYPSLERGEDLYISTEQGARFTILENFFAAIQVNWRWDNSPAPGTERADTAYLFNLGYNFQFSRVR